MPSLCLGTAQFGMEYGVTNERGQLSEEEVKTILRQARLLGISSLDSASSYGNAQAIIGRYMTSHEGFKIVSKLHVGTDRALVRSDVDKWEREVTASLRQLCIDKLDTLLVHNPGAMQLEGKEYLESWLVRVKENGYTGKIGLSIYDENDLKGVDPGLLDVVQLPISLLDQRLLKNGIVDKLSEEGIEIHARSIYLQGLLLTSAERWPGWIGADERKHQKQLEDLARKKGCRLIDLALGFIRSQKAIDMAIIGVSCVEDLNELVKSWSRETPWEESEWETWSIDNSDMLDPRLWPKDRN